MKRDDETPLHYNLINTKNWNKDKFEVVNQLRINTRNSYQCYDVILLINSLPLLQIEKVQEPTRKGLLNKLWSIK